MGAFLLHFGAGDRLAKPSAVTGAGRIQFGVVHLLRLLPDLFYPTARVIFSAQNSVVRFGIALSSRIEKRGIE